MAYPSSSVSPARTSTLGSQRRCLPHLTEHTKSSAPDPRGKGHLVSSHDCLLCTAPSLTWRLPLLPPKKAQTFFCGLLVSFLTPLSWPDCGGVLSLQVHGVREQWLLTQPALPGPRPSFLGSQGFQLFFTEVRGGRRKRAGKQPPPRHTQAPDSRNFTHRPRGRCWTWPAGLWSWSEPQAHPALFPSCLGLEVNKQNFSRLASHCLFLKGAKREVSGTASPTRAILCGR